jgi:hypothetical protein
MRTPGRKFDDDEESYAQRVADFEAWRKRFIVGYVASGVVFLLAMLVFILAILSGSGAIGGVGGILLATSAVGFVATAVYHYLTMK